MKEFNKSLMGLPRENKSSQSAMCGKNSTHLFQNKWFPLSTLSAAVILMSQSAFVQAEPERLIDLGTFRSDNGGYSYGNGVSADGSVVVGSADVENGDSHAYRYNPDTGVMIDLGTLKSDNTGFSSAYAISEDGRTAVGMSETDTGYYHAMRHNEGDAKMTDLGSLKSDNSGNSYATEVSADGRVVTGYSDTDVGVGMSQVFRHNEGDIKMTPLGTLKSDNSGNSRAEAISADGRVIVGYADVDVGSAHAFRHNEGDLKMTDLGTLRSDNTGFSMAHAVSADGRIVVGMAEADDGGRAFKHYEGDAKMTDLGSLRSDNGGRSAAHDISANGLVIVGQASTDSGDNHAFILREGDAKMIDLGTLTSDQSGYSSAVYVSADGRVVAGYSDADGGATQVFKYTEGDAKITSLGTLKSDNSGSAYPDGISADGSVIVGMSDTDDGKYHAFIYKNKMIDVDDSSKMLFKGSDQQTTALNFLQDKLTDALYQGCRPDAGNTCFAAGAKYYQQSNHAVDDTAAYVNIAHRFQPKFYAGLYLEQSVSSGFADSIDANDEQPLVAIYGGFSPSGHSKLGTQIRSAVSTHKISADITRPAILNTEAGKGSTDFKGYAGQIEAAYGIQATDKLLISPVVGVRYSHVERGGYTEAETVDFPAEYGKMQSKQTSLYAGLEAEMNLSKKVNVFANLGVEQVLDHSENMFSVKVPYIGGFKNGEPDTRETKAYAFTGISFEVARNQKIGLGVGYRQSHFKSSQDGLSANLGYQIQF